MDALATNEFNISDEETNQIVFMESLYQCGQQRREVVLRGPVEPVLPGPPPLTALPGPAVELPRLRHPRQARQPLHGARHQPPQDGSVSEALEPKWTDIKKMPRDLPK